MGSVETSSTGLYFLDLAATAAENPADALYNGRILRGDGDGKALEVLVGHQILPDGIDISQNGKLFWTNMGIPSQNDGSVFCCDLDGTDIRTVVYKGNVHTPKQICIDHQASKLYFCDREGLRVMRCNFDGSELETVVQTGDWHVPEQMADQKRWCVGIAISPETGKFYWSQKGPSKGNLGRIFRANMQFYPGEDATSRTDIECLFSNLPEPIDLEIDPDTETLYWTDRGEVPFGNTVNRAKLSKVQPMDLNHAVPSFPGKDYDILIRNLHEAIGLKLDRVNHHIYVTDIGGTLYQFKMDGTERKKVYDEAGNLTGIAVMFH